MQSQKLPLWQLFLFSCAKQRYLPPSRQPGHSTHIRSGIHGTLRSRHTAPVPGNSSHAGPHGTAYRQSSRHSRTRLKTQGTRYARRTWFPNTPCTTKPPASLRTASVFPAGHPRAALPFPGIPRSSDGLTPSRKTRIRPRNHSFSGKPCALRRISAPSGVTRYTPVDSGVMWPMTSTHPMRITCSCKASGTVNNNS